MHRTPAPGAGSPPRFNYIPGWIIMHNVKPGLPQPRKYASALVEGVSLFRVSPSGKATAIRDHRGTGETRGVHEASGLPAVFPWWIWIVLYPRLTARCRVYARSTTSLGQPSCQSHRGDRSDLNPETAAGSEDSARRH